ncbi:response regulator [Methylomonas sp. AM2-LC]|uniref:response regulator transcription factor n=1 Tax=Methylomonas sp. AM2-LC TaxID=3153301 RepID=UPI003264E65E
MTMPKASRHFLTPFELEFAERCALGLVVIIDDDYEILSALAALIKFEGYACKTYTSALTYLQVLNENRHVLPGPRCVLCDVRMPEMDGLQLQQRLAKLNDTPMLLMSGGSGAQEVVSAFHAGALDFLIKPVDTDRLLAAVTNALQISNERQILDKKKYFFAARIKTLTTRELDIAQRVAAGQTNPSIAAEIGIALRTVKLYRKRAMDKLGIVKTLDLVRIADEGYLNGVNNLKAEQCISSFQSDCVDF